MNIELYPIMSIADPLLLLALRIYETSFPPHEQMTPSFWIKNLLTLAEGTVSLTAFIDQDNRDVVGMAFCETIRPVSRPSVVFLWYLCIRADQRGAGIGAQAYQRLISRFFDEGICALVFEVERPDVAIEHGAGAADLAARRIRWYQRNGARLLRNVDYLQHVDNGLPPTPMYLMVHSPHPLTPEEAFRMLTEDVGLNAQAVGPLSLE